MIKINGFQYTIDLDGNVFSIRSGKNIKPYIANGYLKVDLYDNYKRRKVYIHQLMGECFHAGSYFKGAIINHKDGNRKNNSVNNIEWCTYSQNNKHAYEVLGRVCPPRAKGSESCHARAIVQIGKSGDIIKTHGSITEAINIFGSGVEKVLYGKRKTAYGFKWEYA